MILKRVILTAKEYGCKVIADLVDDLADSFSVDHEGACVYAYFYSYENYDKFCVKFAKHMATIEALESLFTTR